MSFAIALTALGGSVALSVRRLPSRLPYAFAKGAAAAGFVWLAVAAGALASLPGTLLLAGLAASAAGDVALALRGRSAFVAGTAAFALAHVAYATAFVTRGIAAAALAVAAVVVGAASLLAWRWLAPYLPRPLVPALAAYVALASAMTALAWASVAAGGPLLAAVGATAFYLSDLGVARERFVAPTGADKLWSLPLYYLGQVLIALSA